MSYTRFGEYVRILRIRNHEVMGDMADLLGVSAAFLSAVENGKKQIPKNWLEKIANHYNLNESEILELQNVIEESKISFKLDLSNTTQTKRNVALAFQRSFENLSEDDAQTILKILGGSKNN